MLIYCPQWKAGSKTETIKDSSLGHEALSQMISALENHRSKEAHQWKNIPESQVKLRNDYRIRNIEREKRSNEPERVKNSQALKAMGTSAGIYNVFVAAVHLLTFVHRYLYHRRASQMLIVVPAQVCRYQNGLCWLARRCTAAFLDHYSTSWPQLPDASLIRPVRHGHSNERRTTGIQC